MFSKFVIFEVEISFTIFLLMVEVVVGDVVDKIDYLYGENDEWKNANWVEEWLYLCDCEILCC